MTQTCCWLQNGGKCRNAVNISKCRYCDYHVQSEYKRLKSNRGILQDSTVSAKLNSQARQAGAISQVLSFGITVCKNVTHIKALCKAAYQLNQIICGVAQL